MFRPAIIPDAPHILELLREFYARQGCVYGIEFDAVSTEVTVLQVIRQGICLVGPTSVAGATIQPFPYNDAAQIAHVHFWYFKRARELRILEALMRACQLAGATHFAAVSHPPNHVIGRHYRKFLLSPCELKHIRRLN